MENNRFSREVSIIHGRIAPEDTIQTVGYAALIDYYKLNAPIPDILSGISHKHKQSATQEWRMFTPRYMPEDTWYGHLVFALKYEGLDLHILKELFLEIKTTELDAIIKKEPTGQYTRRLWFLYEWLTGKKLSIPNATSGNFVDALDENLQYGIKPIKSQRHRVNNNLPGNPSFCPLIRKTEKLEHYIHAQLDEKAKLAVGKIQKDILLRAAAFLLLNDSKSSFAIEGEIPSKARAQRWGQTIGKAGYCSLTLEYLIDLQKIIISDKRFTQLGLRQINSFVGVHDRISGEPIPDHISAKPEDILKLMSGLLDTYHTLKNSDYNAVLMATLIAFGFVFIHPFEDGNGRIHRYLIHHILAEKKFTPKGIVFPVSSVILEKIDAYKEVLESYSTQRLNLINWDSDPKGNVKINGPTTDLYSFFDCTQEAEFLFDCINETIEETLPQETKYLVKYDKLRTFLSSTFDMPETRVTLLVRFLEQNEGKLSKRALDKEFTGLSQDEINLIEEKYQEIFL